MSNEWILTSERLPGDDDNRKVLAQYANGRVGIVTCYNVTNYHVAWMELPEPYQLPKPKRQEWFIGVHDRRCKEDKYPLAYPNVGCGAGRPVRCIEALDGDVDPDAAIKAREFVEKLIERFEKEGGVSDSLTSIHEILNGKDDI